MSICHFSEKTHILGKFLVAALVTINFTKFVLPLFSNIWYLPLTDHPVYIKTVNI